jgi:hypothetical protein
MRHLLELMRNTNGDIDTEQLVVLLQRANCLNQSKRLTKQRTPLLGEQIASPSQGDTICGSLEQRNPTA